MWSLRRITGAVGFFTLFTIFGIYRTSNPNRTFCFVFSRTNVLPLESNNVICAYCCERSLWFIAMASLFLSLVSFTLSISFTRWVAFKVANLCNSDEQRIHPELRHEICRRHLADRRHRKAASQVNRRPERREGLSRSPPRSARPLRSRRVTNELKDIVILYLAPGTIFNLSRLISRLSNFVDIDMDITLTAFVISLSQKFGLQYIRGLLTISPVDLFALSLLSLCPAVAALAQEVSTARKRDEMAGEPAALQAASNASAPHGERQPPRYICHARGASAVRAPEPGRLEMSRSPARCSAC